MPSGIINIDKSKLQNAMREMDFSAPSAFSKQESDYNAFYQLDFETRYDDIEHGFGFLEVGREKIAVHSYVKKPAAGTVFVCHGYFDHVGLYRHVIEKLLTLGFSVIAWDLLGHGLSTGEQGVVDDFNDYKKSLEAVLAAAQNTLQKPWHVVAQSTGAAIVMDYLLHLENNNNPFTKIVLLAPLYRPRGWRMAKLRYYLARPFVKFVEREPTRSSHDQSFIDFVSQDPLRINHLSVQWVGELIKWESQIKLLPATEEKVVIIQGRQDQTVDWKTNIKFIKEKFLNAQVHYIPEAKHHLVNESAAIRNQVFDIMEHALIEDCCI
ncbi:MAG TPA: alpha/beta hydrolase [Pseudomonadales bacterium]